MITSTAIKKIVAEARPLIEQSLDISEKIAGLRDVVTAAGGDWSQLKALIKAQIQDERDDASDGRRVRKILGKADYALAYADMLGLANMNEDNFSREAQAEAEGADPATGEIIEPQPLAAQTVPAQPVASSPAEVDAVETSAPIPDAADEQPVAATEPPRPVVASHSEPVEGAPAGKSAEASASAAPSNVHQLRKRQTAFDDPPHPGCLKPHFCGGHSNLGLCGDCKAAAGLDASEAVRA